MGVLRGSLGLGARPAVGAQVLKEVPLSVCRMTETKRECKGSEGRPACVVLREMVV